MASWEIVALDTVTPQLRAPGTGDTYTANRNILMADGSGYYGPTTAYGIVFAPASSVAVLYAGGAESLRACVNAPYGVNIYYRLGLGPTSAADVGIERIAAKVLKITDGGTQASSGAGVIQLPTFTVATLPAAAAGTTGCRATVSDASAAPVFAASAVGGGAVVAPVYCDGAAWRYG